MTTTRGRTAIILWTLLLATVPATAWGMGGHRMVSTTEASVTAELAEATIEGGRPPAPAETVETALEPELDTQAPETTTSVPAATTTAPSTTTGAPTTTSEATTTTLASGSTGSTAGLPQPVVPTIPEVTAPDLPDLTVPREPPVDVDGEFLGDVNAERQVGLQWSTELEAYAAWHLRAMMTRGVLFHSDLAADGPAGWAWLGENVGTGPTQDSIQSAYLNSPTHADNERFSAYTHMGSASATDAIGMLWTVQIFGAR